VKIEWLISAIHIVERNKSQNGLPVLQMGRNESVNIISVQNYQTKLMWKIQLIIIIIIKKQKQTKKICIDKFK